MKWRYEPSAELTAEGYSLSTYELERAGEAINLTVSHLMEKANSKFIKAVLDGWPPALPSAFHHDLRSRSHHRSSGGSLFESPATAGDLHLKPGGGG